MQGRLKDRSRNQRVKTITVMALLLLYGNVSAHIAEYVSGKSELYRYQIMHADLRAISEVIELDICILNVRAPAKTCRSRSVEITAPRGFTANLNERSPFTTTATSAMPS